MMMAAAAATTSVLGKNFGRKLMKGLQTENNLPKNSTNQLKTALAAKKPLKTAQNGSIVEVAAVIWLMTKASWLAWAEK